MSGHRNWRDLGRKFDQELFEAEQAQRLQTEKDLTPLSKPYDKVQWRVRSCPTDQLEHVLNVWGEAGWEAFVTTENSANGSISGYGSSRILFKRNVRVE